MDNQRIFLRNIRIALGQSEHSERSRELFPDLFKGAKGGTPARNGRTDSSGSTKQQAELVDTLREAALAAGTVFAEVESLDKARDIVVETIRTKEPEFSANKHVILHAHPILDEMRLWKRFDREGVTVHTGFSEDPMVPEKIAASFIGITVPSLVVAESATLIEFANPGTPRSTSLVPSIHIAIVKEKSIVADLERAYAFLAKQKLPNSFLFISGPSKTADIEAHMVYGAHGPRELHLIVVREKVAEAPLETVMKNKHADSGAA